MAKTIATVNTILPSGGVAIEYTSGDSLRDYDIILFDPGFPYGGRIDFSGGGSCMSIETTQRIQSAMKHWLTELDSALKAGKTLFIILNEREEDLGTNGSSMDKKQRMYRTFSINNYEVLSAKVSLRNTKGKHITVVDSAFKDLYDALKDITQYKGILEPEIGRKIYSAKDGASVGAVLTFESLPGRIVLLPHFDFNDCDEGSTEWSKKTLQISHAVISQLVALDAYLREGSDKTPQPQWLKTVPQPKVVENTDKTIADIDKKIDILLNEKKQKQEIRNTALEFSDLLYENGKRLETAIEKTLQLLGYEVVNYRAGDLEIDHIITSPSGLRMIGESEGKDSSAIDISKFRQLESNVNEDFEREGVDIPAKGILFGNGFRFAAPGERKDMFTSKCLVNAKRLGTALIKTIDLFQIAVHILDNPNDEDFKRICREVIENTTGEVVDFPFLAEKSISRTEK